jgi:DNA-binding NarL/FixJ family response regulator
MLPRKCRIDIAGTGWAAALAKPIPRRAELKLAPAPRRRSQAPDPMPVVPEQPPPRRRRNAGAGQARMTTRYREAVLALAAAGHANHEIAAVLGVPEEAVEDVRATYLAPPC